MVPYLLLPTEMPSGSISRRRASSSAVGGRVVSTCFGITISKEVLSLTCATLVPGCTLSSCSLFVYG
jgi:hypothetical protein